jgi:hypothetical protein
MRRVIFLLFLVPSKLFAQTDFLIGRGEDKSSELKFLNNIIQTAQSTLAYAVGPLFGSWMVLKGFKMVGAAERGEKGPGVTMIIAGVCCFAIGPIVSQVLKVM